MSKKLRNIKPSKVNRGALEDQRLREDHKTQNQRALLYILPLFMLAVLVVGIFFGYKFYQRSLKELEPISPSEAVEDDTVSSNPMFLRAVNSASPLDRSFVPVTAESCGVPVAVDAAEPLQTMVAAAQAEGHALLVREGYVSYDEQQQRYENAVAAYRASSESSLVMAEVHVKKTLPPAGESEQQTGLLVDLSVKTDGKFADTAAYAWLVRHCVDYGFILRYPDRENVGGFSYSSHLFRYVGKTYAYNMRALDMNFDEYLLYLAAQ